MAVELIVLYKWKPSVSEERIRYHLGEIGKMKERVPGLLEVKFGPRCYGPEQWSHGARLTFASPAALDEYSRHPEHDRIASLIMPDLETIHYCGFEAVES